MSRKRPAKVVLAPDEVGPICWFDLHGEVINLKCGQKAKRCQNPDCEESGPTRSSRIATHGVNPRNSGPVQLSDHEAQDLLREAARKKIYLHATPFHPASLVL